MTGRDMFGGSVQSNDISKGRGFGSWAQDCKPFDCTSKQHPFMLHKLRTGAQSWAMTHIGSGTQGGLGV